MPGLCELRIHVMILSAALIAFGVPRFAPGETGRMMAPVPGVPRMLFATAEPGSDHAGKPDEKSKTRKRTIVWSALYLVAGIALLGVLLIVVIVLWGIRLRQRSRMRKPPEAAFDPLWYLKKGANETPPPPNESEPETDRT